jgi:hypothetical protein
MLLAFTLVEEAKKQNASFYAPYISVLPKLSEIFRLESFDPAQLAMFDDRAVTRTIKSQEARLKTFFDALVAQNLQMAAMFSDFIWAYYTVRSRATPFPASSSDNRALGMGLVPFADMFNVADDVGRTAERTISADYIEIQSSFDSIEGEALLFHGPFSNLFLLVTRGYASEDNTADGYSLLLRGFPPGDPLVHAKETIWNASRSSVNDVVSLRPDLPSSELSGFFRLLVMSQAENITSDLMIRPFHADEEDVALSGCMKAVEHELGNFRSSLEEDESELVREDVIWTQEKTVALRYRIGRKRILSKALCYYKRLRAENSALGQKAGMMTRNDYLSEYDRASKEAHDECYV